MSRIPDFNYRVYRKYPLLVLLVLSMVLCMFLSVGACAETVTAEEFTRTDITIPERVNPIGTILTRQLSFAPENTHQYSFTTPYSNDETASIIITYAYTGSEPTEMEWDALGDYLVKTLGKSITNIQSMTTAQMVQVLRNAMLNDINSATLDAYGMYPVYAQPNNKLYKIEGYAPYYATVRKGDKSGNVQKLQRRLAFLGYLDDTADGVYGNNTAIAVKSAREELEAIMNKQGITILSSTTPDDGSVADQTFQVRLFSDVLLSLNEPLAKGSNPTSIMRMQKRLITLNYLSTKADGDYGDYTELGVRLFQYYNELPVSGTADIATIKAIFSNDAIPCPTRILTVGSSGDDVKELQQKLITAGFLTASADGSYGSATEKAIKDLQTYLQILEVYPETLTSKVYGVTTLDTTYQGTANSTELLPVLDNPGNPAATPVPERPSNDLVAVVVSTPPPSSLSSIQVTGIADPLTLERFYSSAFPVIPSPQKIGDDNLNVKRIQTRLRYLDYVFFGADGSYGEATKSALSEFQSKNDLSSDGVAGADTLNVLFSSQAKSMKRPYVVKVSISDQKVRVYGLDDNGDYTELVRTMSCSTGLNNSTPRGTFQATTYPGNRWHFFQKFNCWAQYSYYIEGDILFHSVIFNEKGGSATSSSVNNLGSPASHGCVRLAVKDAQWIYENCPSHTKVIIY